MTPRQVEWRFSTGEWVRVHEGVYRLAAAPVTWHQWLMGAGLGYGLARDGEVEARFDLACLEAKIALEFVSYRHHFGRQSWRHDTRRLRRAAAAGWRVFNLTEDDVRDGCRRVAGEVAGARAA